MNTLDYEQLIPVEDIYEIQNQLKLDDGEHTSKGEIKVDEAYSVYCNQIKEDCVDKQHGKVKDLILFFQMKMTNLNEKQDKIISQIKRNVVEDRNVFRKLNRAAAYGHQKHGQVRDLINAFENYTVDPIESHDENSRHMTRMEDEKTKRSEKEMEENKVVLYEKLNNIDSHIYEPLNNICTERGKF